MKHLLFSSLILFFTLSACKKKGCTDPDAVNYQEKVKENNQSCIYESSVIRVSYGADDIQQLDLYLPPKHDLNTKVILMVHGGGWVVGYNAASKVTSFSGRYGWDILNPLLQEGYACGVMKYRTACYQENPVESTGNAFRYLNPMMEDLDLAITHLKNNANEYGIANNHFQLLGESAGGHIVLYYALRNEADPTVKSAVSMFGPTNLDDTEWKIGLHELDSIVPGGILVDGINYFRTTENDCELETNKKLSVLKELRSFGDHDTVRLNEENTYLQLISPTDNVNKNTAIYIMHGNQDDLVPVSQATLMYEAYLTKYPSAQVCGLGIFNGDLKKSIYENCGHGWIGGSCKKNVIMNDIVNWMNAH